MLGSARRNCYKLYSDNCHLNVVFKVLLQIRSIVIEQGIKKRNTLFLFFPFDPQFVCCIHYMMNPIWCGQQQTFNHPLVRVGGGGRKFRNRELGQKLHRSSPTSQQRRYSSFRTFTCARVLTLSGGGVRCSGITILTRRIFGQLARPSVGSLVSRRPPARQHLILILSHNSRLALALRIIRPIYGHSNS